MNDKTKKSLLQFTTQRDAISSNSFTSENMPKKKKSGHFSNRNNSMSQDFDSNFGVRRKSVDMKNISTVRLKEIKEKNYNVYKNIGLNPRTLKIQQKFHVGGNKNFSKSTKYGS